MTEKDAITKPSDKQSTQLNDGNSINAVALTDRSITNKDQQRQMTDKCVQNGLLPGCELNIEIENDKVKRDARGHVTEITRPEGDTTRFKYDANGKLNEVTMPGGTVLTTTDGVNWKSSETGKTAPLKVEVKDDGTYSLEQNGKKAVLKPDGSSVRSEIPANGVERVTSVTHANGQSSEFRYGADGKLNEVKLPGGTVLTTADGGKTWLDHSTNKTSQMSIDVAKDGTYYIERDGKMAKMHVDGHSEPLKRTLEDPAKVKERHPANYKPGHPYEEIVYEDGTVRQLRPGGTTVESRKDMTITERNDHSVSVTIKGDTREAKPMHPERGIKTTNVDERGNVTYKYDDGTSSTHYRGGGVEDVDKAGNSKLYLGKNVIQETTKHADKTTVTTSDGHVTSTDHDKSHRVFRYDDKGNMNEIVGNMGTWKRMAGADGKEYWQNQENPKLQWHGKMQVDKEGNLTYTPHDPNAQGWKFSRDGRDIPVQAAPRQAQYDQAERRQPIVVDTSVAVPRDLFDKDGTPSTVKIPPEKGSHKK